MKQLLVVLLGAFFPLTQDSPEVRIASATWFPPNLTITADANLVELAATVRDRHEHPVAGLTVADFEILDNKEPREITVFRELKAGATVPVAAIAAAAGKDSPAPQPDPRTIALFFDDVHVSPRFGLTKVSEAAAKLISHDLHPGDKVGIFTSSGKVSLDFTADRDALLAALAGLIPRPLSVSTPNSECPALDVWEAYAIIEHVDPAVELVKMQEAAACVCPPPITFACRNEQRIPLQSKATMVWMLSKFRSTTTLEAIGIVMRHLAAEPNKRVLVLMTPGFPAEKGMESQTSKLMNAALRANIRISTMKLPGRMPFDIVRQEFMGQAAKATGGQFVDGYYDPSTDLRKLVTTPDVSYVLGFSPPGEPDGQTHTLKTRIVGNRGYSVEARTAYFAAKPAGETAQQHIDRVAMARETHQEFSASLAVQAGPGSIQVKVSVDAKALRFPEKEGRRVEELALLTILEDAEGNFVAGKESLIDLALLPVTLTEKQRDGISAATSFPAPRHGSYRVREVIREASQNRIWSGMAAVEIP